LALPPYFAQFDWKEAARVADKDIIEGKVNSFSSVEDLMADLKA